MFPTQIFWPSLSVFLIKAPAQRWLTTVCSPRSRADFSVEFWTLAEQAGWEEKALRGAFLNGLNERIKHELATKDMPTTLSAIVDMCIRLDDHMREFGGGRRSAVAPWGPRTHGGILFPLNGERLNRNLEMTRNSLCS